MADGAASVLDVRDLTCVFETRGGSIHAVNSVTFSLGAGELLGVVGESGSGKSVTMMSLIGLVPSPPAKVTGTGVTFGGIDLLTASEDELRAIRGARIGFVFQDPMTSLNPVFTVGFQLMEPLRKHMGHDQGRGPRAGPRSCWSLSAFPMPNAASRIIRTSFRAGCANG